MTSRPRCAWAESSDLYRAYHDEEWGTPVHDDCRLFEFLVLEGAQAGLSWITILNKRANYRRAFADFDVQRVAAYDEAKIAQLLADPGLVRNRRKLESAVNNAQAFIRVQQEFGSFDSYLWRFVDGRPIVGRWRTLSEVPVSTPLAESLSRDLKTRGFSFVGPTICYSYLQAVGLVNDHVRGCWRCGAAQNDEDVSQPAPLARG